VAKRQEFCAVPYPPTPEVDDLHTTNPPAVGPARAHLKHPPEGLFQGDLERFGVGIPRTAIRNRPGRFRFLVLAIPEPVAV